MGGATVRETASLDGGINSHKFHPVFRLAYPPGGLQLFDAYEIPRSPRLGFGGSFAWKTRPLTSAMAREAGKRIGTTRDKHWLSKHPINYG